MTNLYSTQTRAAFNIRMMNIADTIALGSTCKRRQAGAVGIDAFRRIVGIGYNGQPSRFHKDDEFRHCIDAPCPGANDPPGDTSHCEAIHAEVNMVLNSSNPFSITVVYLTDSPCFRCALVLANLPLLDTVYFRRTYADGSGLSVLGRADITIYQI